MTDPTTTDMIMPEGSGFKTGAGRAIPHCLRCNKPVDSVSWETPGDYVYGREMYGAAVAYVMTGECIIEVRCHGETWKASNFRGRLAP